MRKNLAWLLLVALGVVLVLLLPGHAVVGTGADEGDPVSWTGSRSTLAQFLDEVDVTWAGVSSGLTKLSPALWSDLIDGGETSFLLVLAEQADLGHVTTLPQAERQRAVYDALRNTARRVQSPLRVALDAQGVTYRPFYVVNMLYIEGDVALALRLAARSEVARLEANPAVRMRPFEEGSAASVTRSTVEWGVRAVNADQVWALGCSGQGILVAGQDTGYDWQHPALKGGYRGWDGVTVTHDYHWHDAIHSEGSVCGADAPAPCDDNGHGTHTMGTILGDDRAGAQTGVAPGAQWIGCRNMDRGVGTPATYAECFEFFLAPYPVGGDPMVDGEPGLAPHVINNSWTCPPSEGCDAEALRAVVENVRAAGIVVVASAGNAGGSCETVNAPPARHDAVFSVGATDSGGQIAYFSSRGPVIVGDEVRLKPDVSAPGVSVRSCLPGGGYGYKSGTSMAAPHVTGLVALLWSAAPGLVGDVDRTEAVIRETARPALDDACGGAADGHPNNVYGWGIVDALSAVREGSVGLSLSARVEPHWVSAGQTMAYSFTVGNTAVLSRATGVILTSTLPLSTTFAQASGDYARQDETILWNLGTLAPTQHVSVTLVVTVADDLSRGTALINADYAVHSAQVPTPTFGAPVVSSVPWRFYWPMILQMR